MKIRTIWAWLDERHQAKQARGWHHWFAWYPVEIDDEWVWLERVDRAMAAMYWIYSPLGTEVPLQGHSK